LTPWSYHGKINKNYKITLKEVGKMENSSKDILNVQSEVRKALTGAFDEGLNKEEARESVINKLIDTCNKAEMTVLGEIMESPQHGLKFAYSVNNALGIVNSLLVEEYEMIPIHISEMELISSQALEAITGVSIEQLLTEVEEKLSE
jgi:hypothetical protein